jgi:hypothetical protein
MIICEDTEKYEKIYENSCRLTGYSMQIKNEIIPFMAFLDKENIVNFLEIGVCDGGTFYIWAYLTDENGIKIGLDLPNGPWSTNDPKNTKSNLQIAVIKQTLTSFKPNTHIFFGDSKSQHVFDWTVETLNGKELDFLFIDGDHSYEGAKSDYEKYSPLVKSGGVIAFHDIKETDFHKKAECYVYKLWKEIGSGEIEFVDYDSGMGGIGVIRKC